MQAFLQSMTVPFLACLVLTGIHVYLGIHVLARKVIFVDLALATIAALGAVWGALLGWDVHEDVWAIKGFSLAFTFVGAVVFSLTRMRHERVPHEAIIGITYAVALAAIILGSARLPHGAEEVRDLQAGSILWVDGATIAITAALYAAVGLFHFAFRRRFLAISRDPERAAQEGIAVRWWDFLFYVSFGVVVTSSVSIAGVLLVFSYLVIPAVVAVLFADGLAARLAIGWTVGTVVSAAGVSVSYTQDLPSGPVIVVGFGAFLALAGVAHYLLHAPARALALARVAGVAAGAVLLALGSLALRKRADTDLAHLLETGTKSERLIVLARVAEDPSLWQDIAAHVPALLAGGAPAGGGEAPFPDARGAADPAAIEVRLALLQLLVRQERAELAPTVAQLLDDPDDTVREEAVHVLRLLHAPGTADALAAAAGREPDEWLRVEIAEGLLELGDPRGVAPMLAVMEHGEARQARRDAWEHLQSHVAFPLAYDPSAPTPERSASVAAFRAWWQEHPDARVEPGPAGEAELGR